MADTNGAMRDAGGAAEASDEPAGAAARGEAGAGGNGASQEIAEHTASLGGLPVFWRSAPGPRGGAPAAVPLYLHGVPTSSDDWLGFLARTGGIAVDLPGFGRSGKPGDRTYTIPEYLRFIEDFLALLELERTALVMHDWGAVGLAFAQAHPERVATLVLIDAVPLLPGYRWHPVARIWRTPVLGELMMGSTTPVVLRLATRNANAAPGPLPAAWRRSVLDHFDHGTQRAILRLYRSSSPAVLEQAGAQLSRLDMPALVIWGARDPYIPARFAHDYARALPRAELDLLDDAGHWPWLDRPDVVDRVARFLAERP
jgi:pimeloyl-ACP methyl ester carboxylesterase